MRASVCALGCWVKEGREGNEGLREDVRKTYELPTTHPLHFTCAPLVHSLKSPTLHRQDSRLRVWETLDAEIKASKERKAAESSEGGSSNGRGPGARGSGGKAATFRVCASDLEDGATLYLHMVAPESEGDEERPA